MKPLKSNNLVFIVENYHFYDYIGSSKRLKENEIVNIL